MPRENKTMRRAGDRNPQKEVKVTQTSHGKLGVKTTSDVLKERGGRGGKNNIINAQEEVNHR